MEARTLTWRYIADRTPAASGISAPDARSNRSCPGATRRPEISLPAPGRPIWIEGRVRDLTTGVLPARCLPADAARGGWRPLHVLPKPSDLLVDYLFRAVSCPFHGVQAGLFRWRTIMACGSGHAEQADSMLGCDPLPSTGIWLAVAFTLLWGQTDLVRAFSNTGKQPERVSPTRRRHSLRKD